MTSALHAGYGSVESNVRLGVATSAGAEMDAGGPKIADSVSEPPVRIVASNAAGKGCLIGGRLPYMGKPPGAHGPRMF